MGIDTFYTLFFFFFLQTSMATGVTGAFGVTAAYRADWDPRNVCEGATIHSRRELAQHA